MLMTPREAMLDAENKRLRAENMHLRELVDPALDIRPYGTTETIEMRSPRLETITLPRQGGILGELRNNSYAVLGTFAMPPERFEVAYYCDAITLKSRADYAVNEVLPWMHEQFIRALIPAIQKS